MTDDEIIGIKCNACGCAITPELHEAISGEYRMTFFICPFCHEKYVICVTDEELRSGIAEYTDLRRAAENDQLTDEGIQRMRELRLVNLQRSRELRRIFTTREETNG